MGGGRGRALLSGREAVCARQGPLLALGSVRRSPLLRALPTTPPGRASATGAPRAAHRPPPGQRGPRGRPAAPAVAGTRARPNRALLAEQPLPKTRAVSTPSAHCPSASRRRATDPLCAAPLLAPAAPLAASAPLDEASASAASLLAWPYLSCSRLEGARAKMAPLVSGVVGRGAPQAASDAPPSLRWRAESRPEPEPGGPSARRSGPPPRKSRRCGHAGSFGKLSRLICQWSTLS